MKKIQHHMIYLKKIIQKHLKNDVKGLKIGIPKEYFGEGINEEVKEKLEEGNRNI